MLKKNSNKSGFTLVELVIVITILGILAAVAIPKVMSLRDDAMKVSKESVVGAIRSALSIYRLEKESTLDNDGWPDYPETLDSANNAAASDSNKLFTNILEPCGQVTDGKWSKTDNVYVYTRGDGTTASSYIYTPGAGHGTFDTTP